ncbi:hypothetical protein [Nocardioides taihuensis]|uniref:Uncharacterized protein n=1 Tax=Nocardioides taihuensis TaxID=1835606 RepID=A0ABW0BI06_9ACTN
MLPVVVLLVFVAVVLALAVRFAPETRGRSCCAPVDPDLDLRMRGA